MAANNDYIGIILDKLGIKQAKKVKKAFYTCRI